MPKYQYALLLDDLMPNERTKVVLDELSKYTNYDITIFVLNRENIVNNIWPVFNIADYFNFRGVSIVSSDRTLQKTIKYPVNGPVVVLGTRPGYLSASSLNLDLIERLVDEQFARNEHAKNVG